ncbi:N-acetyltransferase [Desulfovibrio aminophilus]|uniref:GNAT family N-acetyltransferase n=1 Tax=Desulfovibrio aminophilus TaxID=81425 RepID=UPI000404377E
MFIRDERPDDVSRISRIQYDAFKNHPVHAPGAEPTEHRIVERLRASGRLTLSLLAEAGDEAVGHVALSPAVVGAAREGWFLLGPVGVSPHFQGQGIGSALVRAALRRMREVRADGVVLVGGPRSTPASASSTCPACSTRACRSNTSWRRASTTRFPGARSSPTRPSPKARSAHRP